MSGEPSVPGPVPLVSIVLPVRDRRDLVRETADSVLAQDWPRIELVVVDDGSTDGTAEAVEDAYGGRVKVVRQANAGPAAARNSGFRASSGEYLSSVDSDDLMPPGSIRSRAEVLAGHPEADAAYGRQVLQGEHHDPSLPLPSPGDPHAWPAGDLLARYVRDPFFRHTDLLFRRRLLPPGGDLYNPEVWNFEDHLMVLWLLARARCLPCHSFTSIVRPAAGFHRQRFLRPPRLDDAMAPIARTLADPVLSSRLGDLLGTVRARYLHGLAGIAYRLGEGRLYRRRLLEAWRADPGTVRKLKGVRRYLLSFFPRKAGTG